MCRLPEFHPKKATSRDPNTASQNLEESYILLYMCFYCVSLISLSRPNPHPKYRPLHWPCTNELPRKDDQAGINGRLPKQKCFKLNMHLKTNSPLSFATQLNSWQSYLFWTCFLVNMFVGCVLQMGLSDPFNEYCFTCFQHLRSKVAKRVFGICFRPKHLHYNDHMPCSETLFSKIMGLQNFLPKTWLKSLRGSGDLCHVFFCWICPSGRPCPATKMLVWIPVATSVQKLVSLRQIIFYTDKPLKTHLEPAILSLKDRIPSGNHRIQLVQPFFAGGNSTIFTPKSKQRESGL